MKRFKAVILAALIILLSLMLTGCLGKEPNEIAYVVALGIDSVEDGNYKVTIQYANPTKISGGSEEGGQSKGNVVENLAIEAPNLYAAVGLANQIDSKNFSLSHTKLVVFSQEIAEKGLKDITDIFIRSEELRPDVYLAVAIGSAGEYLEAVNPVMEINPAKYYQLIFDKNNIAGLPEGIEKNFFFGVETGDYDSLLPITGVAQKGETEKGKEDGEENSEDSPTKTNTKQRQAPLNEKPFEYKMRDYIGGQNAIALKSKSEAMGSAIFKGDKMVGILGSIETDIYRLLSSDYAYSYLTLYNDKTPENPITVRSIQKKSPKYKIDTKNKTITVKLSLEGDIYSVPSGYSIADELENFESNSEKYIKEACENFMRKILENYDSDIFHLNERSKSEFLTNSAYEEYKKGADYKTFDINVEVDFDVRRTGLIIKES